MNEIVKPEVYSLSDLLELTDDTELIRNMGITLLERLTDKTKERKSVYTLFLKKAVKGIIQESEFAGIRITVPANISITIPEILSGTATE